MAAWPIIKGIGKVATTEILTLFECNCTTFKGYVLTMLVKKPPNMDKRSTVDIMFILQLGCSVIKHTALMWLIDLYYFDQNNGPMIVMIRTTLSTAIKRRIIAITYNRYIDKLVCLAAFSRDACFRFCKQLEQSCTLKPHKAEVRDKGPSSKKTLYVRAWLKGTEQRRRGDSESE